MCCCCEAAVKVSFANAMKWISRMKKNSFMKFISKLNAVVSFSHIFETVNIHKAESKT